MADYHHVASVIFLNPSGEFILQRRDDTPGIRNPGRITAWGGAVERGESTLQAAVREVREETNLQPSGDDFEFFGDYPRSHDVNGAQVLNHVYILRNIDEQSLKVFEGQGYEVINPETKQDNKLYSDLTRELLGDYRKKVLHKTQADSCIT